MVLIVLSIAASAIDYFVFLHLRRKNTLNTRISGKPIPARTPAFRFSPAFCDTVPTIAGPSAPPRSPASASSANIAVPPVGSVLEEMLIEPGHIIPTEKPHRMHPIRPSIGR